MHRLRFFKPEATIKHFIATAQLLFVMQDEKKMTIFDTTNGDV